MANIDTNFDGLTKLRDWWGKVKQNFININTQLVNHTAGIADKHAAQDVTYSGNAIGSTVKEALDNTDTRIDNLVITGTDHDPFVTDSLIDAEGENFGPAPGNETYLNGRLTKWEQKTISHLADYAKYVAQPVYNVKGFGAVGDGVTNDTAAIQAAIDAANAVGGGIIFFPKGIYLITSSLVIPTGIILVGAGKYATILKRAFTGNFISSFGGYCGIEHLTIDGNTTSYGAGKGVIMPANTPNSYMLFVEIKNFSEACLEFQADGGSTFKAIGCHFYTTGALGTIAAVKVAGTDTAATSRHFYACESGGCTLFDFGGCNDFYVSGGYSNGLIFGVNATKVMLNNMRIGAAAGTITIKGAQHQLSNSVFSTPVVLECINSKFDCEVPSYDITDNGSGNNVKIIGTRTYTCNWTTSGTQPTLGNGTLKARFNRNGNNVKCFIDLTIGSTTNVGTGVWRFSLPFPDDTLIVQVGGSGFTQGASSNLAFQCRVNPGQKQVELFYVDSAGLLKNITDTSTTWSAGTTIRFFVEYMCV